MAMTRSVQRVWAREHGLSRRASLGDILKAQIEEHRADVFYNLDATGWDPSFIEKSSGMRQARHRLACGAVSQCIVFGL